MTEFQNDVFRIVTSRQRLWAQGNGLTMNPRWADYLVQLDNNLFEPLSGETRREFAEAGGEEFTAQNGGKPPKFHALHSSAALVCNLFEYWRHRDIRAIAAACGAAPGCRSLKFEQKRAIRPSWKKPPHIDCELGGPGVLPTAIESKFLEPYNPRKKAFTLHPVYAQESLWKDLPNCGRLACAFAKGTESFSFVDVPQLLRHILGLATYYKGPSNFHLLYLWYEVPNPVGPRSEIDRFKTLIGNEIDFDARTHQQVFRDLLAHLDAHADYRDYMMARYFAM